MTDRRPILTVGMAHYDDYDGAYFTIQSLRAHHDCSQVEFVVVDNHPESPHGQGIADLVRNWIPGGKYVPLPEAVGTSVPRDRIFREASAPNVLCMDCHVLLVPGALDALIELLRHLPRDAPDLITGPLLNDRLGVLATHFNDQWRSEMWGTWGSAWKCGCSMGAATHFSPVQLDGNQLEYRALKSQEVIDACPFCDEPLPLIGWAGHEKTLRNAGYTPLAELPEPFEIPGMGLGLFAGKRDGWVGFHTDARGFGGEEMYVHQKVRQAGGTNVCLPALRWIHRFGRPGGVRYPISRHTKVRNYVLEFNELGLDLEPVRQHFVDSGLLSAAEWDQLVADPIKYHQQAQRAPRKQFAQRSARDLPMPPVGDHNLDTLFDWAKQQPRDLDQHADKIRELASQALHVTAICKRREWDVFLLAGRPDDVVIWTTEHDDLHEQLHQVVLATEVNPRAPRRIKHYTVGQGHPHGDRQIDETDLLVLDTVHHGHQVYHELIKFSSQVRRRIVIRGTQAFGELSEDKQGPGLLVGLRRFMRDRPEWSVIYHSANQYGLTVISRDPKDKPKLPGTLQMAANFAKAMVDYVSDGLQNVTREQYEARAEVCTLCDQRVNDRCAACGCFLSKKASMRAMVCPLGKWPETEPDLENESR